MHFVTFSLTCVLNQHIFSLKIDKGKHNKTNTKDFVFFTPLLITLFLGLVRKIFKSLNWIQQKKSKVAHPRLPSSMKSPWPINAASFLDCHGYREPCTRNHSPSTTQFSLFNSKNLSLYFSLKGNNSGHRTVSAGAKNTFCLTPCPLVVLCWTYQHLPVLFSTTSPSSDNTQQQRRHFYSHSFGHF